MQLLEARSGRLDYTFPLAPETGQALQMELFVLRARVNSQHPFEVTTSGLPRLTEVDRPDDYRANVFFGDEQISPREDFTLTIRQTGDLLKPTGASASLRRETKPLDITPCGCRPCPNWTRGDPLPRSLTFVIDISSSMQRGKLQAVKGALTAAIARLEETDLFNIVVFQPPGRFLCRGPGACRPVQQGVGHRLHQPPGRPGCEQFRSGTGPRHAAGLPVGADQPRHLPDRRPCPTSARSNSSP